MSGLAVLCNTGPLIEFRGGHFQLKGRTLRHIGEAEAQIMYMRGNVFSHIQSIVDNLDKSLPSSVLEPVIRNIRPKWLGCTSMDIHRFYSTLEGRIFSFWQCMRHNGLTYSECEEGYCESADADPEWEAKIKWSIELASGDAEVNRLYKIAGLARIEDAGNAVPEYLIYKCKLFSSLFSEPYGFLPDEVADMTMGQISMLTRDKKMAIEDIKAETDLMKRHKNLGLRKAAAVYEHPYRELLRT